MRPVSTVLYTLPKFFVDGTAEAQYIYGINTRSATPQADIEEAIGEGIVMIEIIEGKSPSAEVSEPASEVVALDDGEIADDLIVEATFSS